MGEICVKWFLLNHCLPHFRLFIFLSLMSKLSQKSPAMGSDTDSSRSLAGREDAAEDDIHSSNRHPSTQFVDPPVYKYFESVQTEVVGRDQKSIKAEFAMDLDSFAIVSDTVEHVLQRLHPNQQTTPTLTISSNFQRTKTPRSSRFYVKTNGREGGVKLKNKLKNNVHHPINLARFPALRLGEITSSNMKFQLEMYLVSESSFHGATNYFSFDVLYPLCAAYNAVTILPDKFIPSNTPPKRVREFKNFLNTKVPGFSIPREDGKMMPWEREEGILINLNHEDAKLFFFGVQWALLNMALDAQFWLTDYLHPVLLPVKTNRSYGCGGLTKHASSIVGSQLFCAQAAGIQNIYTLKPSRVFELGRVEDIRNFCLLASNRIMENIKHDVGGEEDTEDEDEATLFLFDVALTVTPIEPGVSFLTSHKSGIKIVTELMNQRINDGDSSGGDSPQDDESTIGDRQDGDDHEGYWSVGPESEETENEESEDEETPNDDSQEGGNDDSQDPQDEDGGEESNDEEARLIQEREATVARLARIDEQIERLRAERREERHRAELGEEIERAVNDRQFHRWHNNRGGNNTQVVDRTPESDEAEARLAAAVLEEIEKRRAQLAIERAEEIERAANDRHYRNWIADDPVRQRVIGRTVPRRFRATVTRNENNGNQNDNSQRGNNQQVNEWTDNFLNMPNRRQVEDDSPATRRLEREVRFGAAKGYEYVGYENFGFLPPGQHPGNWNHRAGAAGTENGRDKLQMYPVPVRVEEEEYVPSLPLLTGPPETPYHRACQETVQSIHEVLTNTRTALDANQLSTETKNLRQWMHETRTANVKQGQYERILVPEAITQRRRTTNVNSDESSTEEAPQPDLADEEDGEASLDGGVEQEASLDGGVEQDGDGEHSTGAPSEDGVDIEIVVENKRRGIREFPQLGSSVVGNCHISNSTLQGTTILIDGTEPARGYRSFFLLAEGTNTSTINGVNMYTGFLRNFWKKKCYPDFYQKLATMVSLTESVLGGEDGRGAEHYLMTDNTKKGQTNPEGNQGKTLSRTMEMCSMIMGNITGRMHHSDSHGVRLELTFTFDGIDADTRLTWPLPSKETDTNAWFRVAQTTDLCDFFSMFKERNVSVLKRLFCNKCNLDRVCELSPPAKTAVVFLVECLVKVMDANGFLGPISEAFATDRYLTVPDEAIVRVTQHDRDITGLEYGIDPSFLRCTRVSEYKMTRPPGFAVPSTEWLAAPLGKHVFWPNCYLQCCNLVEATIKCTYAATQELKNTGPRGGPPEHKQLKQYILQNRLRCPKFVSIDPSELLKIPDETKQFLLMRAAVDINNILYNPVWKWRIKNYLKRKHSITISNRDLAIPNFVYEFDDRSFSQQVKDGHIRMARTQERSIYESVEDAERVLEMAFSFRSVGHDLQWKKCPVRNCFRYTVKLFSVLQNAALSLPTPPTSEEGGRPLHPTPTNLFATGPELLLAEHFAKARCLPDESLNAQPILWSTTRDRLSKHIGVATALSPRIPALPQSPQGRAVARRTTYHQNPSLSTRIVEVPTPQRRRLPNRQTEEEVARGPTSVGAHNSRCHITLRELHETTPPSTKLRQNAFFASVMDRHSGKGYVAIHEVICLRVNILCILEFLATEEGRLNTFQRVARTPSVWQKLSGKVILHANFDYTYLFSNGDLGSNGAIGNKNKNMKKTSKYPLTEVASVQDLLDGPQSLPRGSIPHTLWNAATRSLRTSPEVLEPFFETASNHLRDMEVNRFLANEPPDHVVVKEEWEGVLQQILQGYLFPSHLEKIVDARTVYMKRQAKAMEYATAHPDQVIEATNYKNEWISPDQSDRNLTDPPVSPPVKAPYITIPSLPRTENT